MPPGASCGALPQAVSCWGASEYAYAAGITDLAEKAGLAAAPARLAGVWPET